MATEGLERTLCNGVYRCGAGSARVLERHAARYGQRLYAVHAVACRGRAQLLQQIAEDLSFPAFFGANWDALADCLRDLSWLRWQAGLLLLFELPPMAARELEVLTAILAEACADWERRGRVFRAFLAAGPEVAVAALPL